MQKSGIKNCKQTDFDLIGFSWEILIYREECFYKKEAR